MMTGGWLGESVTTAASLGGAVDVTGLMVEAKVGDNVAIVSRISVTLSDGALEKLDGLTDGLTERLTDGSREGLADGRNDGPSEGLPVGTTEGITVGTAVKDTGAW